MDNNSWRYSIERSYVPLPVNGDAYTVSKPLTSNKAREKSVYNLSFRDPKRNMLLYGVSDFLADILKDRVRWGDIQRSISFMRSAHAFGYGMKIDEDMWTRVMNEFYGALPILIEGLPEGSLVYPGEPVLQVHSLSEGFGEVAALIEAALVGTVSVASASLTIRRELLDLMESYVREDEPHLSDADVRFKASIMIHDFGMRASSNIYESQTLGRTHLLVFPGTDTFNAAYQAWEYNDCKGVGGSIAALAHRTVQSYDSQYEAFENAAREAMQNEPGIVSLVSDCYDFNATIDGDYKKLCEKYPKLVAVARPDSGDYLANAMKIVTEAANQGFYVSQPNGRKAMTTRRFILGDSMNPEKMVKVMETLKENGFSPVNCGIFGVGGWLRNTPTRDTLSVAYKLSAMGKNNEPVVKLSDTRAKLSIPGIVDVVRGSSMPTVFLRNGEKPANSSFVTYYDGSRDRRFSSHCFENFGAIRSRVLDSYRKEVPSENVLDEQIIKIQDEKFAEHKRDRSDFIF